MSTHWLGELVDARTSLPVVLAGAGQALVLLAALTLSPPVAAESYESAFAQYRSHRTERAATDWRDANRSAGELGGFVGQTRASPPLPRGTAAAGTTTAPAMTGMAEMMKSLAGAAPRSAPGPTR